MKKLLLVGCAVMCIAVIALSQGSAPDLSILFDRGFSVGDIPVANRFIGGTTVFAPVGTTGTGSFVRATSPTFVTPALGAASATSYATATRCTNAAAPAVCAAAPAGFVVVAAAGTTVTVNTTAVKATSQIMVQEDVSLGTALSVTCNVTAATAPPTITARTAATSFEITTTAPAVNPRCFSYVILN